MPKVRVNDIELYYETEGEGEPLLLLHGLGSSVLDWENQIGEMARSFRVIACDMRGHGRSEKPTGPYSVAQFASDTADLLKALNAAPAHICGLSMGGMIAFQLAVDFPALVRSLVIVNSGPAMVLKKPSQRALVGLRFFIVRWFGMRAMAKIVAGPLFPKPDQKQLRETFTNRVAENDPRAYLDSVRAINGWSILDRVSGIRCPVLVISSDHDYTPVEVKREYAALIPGAVVTVLKDSRHAAPVDQPAEFNRIVLEFLGQLKSKIPA
jgi:3-oxoadipate enol-lactonase